MSSKPVIFVVISVLVVAFIYSSYSRAFAEPADPNWGEEGGCDVSPDFKLVTCCWTEPDLSCDFYGENCGPIQLDRSRTGPFAPPQGDGVLQQPPNEGEGGILPLTRGQSVLPQDSVLQQQQQQQPPADQGASELPVTEGTQPATVEEEPMPPCPDGQVFNEESGLCMLEDCPEGQILNEETGLCVVDEQEEAVEEQPQAEEPSESQSDDEEQRSFAIDNKGCNLSMSCFLQIFL